jgi:hypothetical protein
VPHRLGTTCPHCTRAVWFEFDPYLGTDDVNKGPRMVNCPGCRGAVSFYVISPPHSSQVGWLWAHPSPKTEHIHRGEIAAALGQMHPALREAYDEATATLASGHASSATIQARRTLEGLVKHLLEDADHKVTKRAALDQLIRTLANHLDLTKPLTDTAHAVREGGNVGAHYDAQITASKELAAKTVNLVEAIADYLLVLPKKVEELRALLEHEPTKDSGETEAP